MDEYIKKESVIEQISEWDASGEDRYENSTKVLKSRISDIPAAKVREDITAEWEYDSDNLPICPNCEEVALQRLHFDVDKHVLDCRFELSRYCHNCGARMTSQREDGIKSDISHYDC